MMIIGEEICQRLNPLLFIALNSPSADNLPNNSNDEKSALIGIE